MPHPAVDDYLRPMERPVIAQFYVQAVKLEFESAKQGRPIFKDQEFVAIIIPGIHGTSSHQPVNDEHRERWPKEYAAFKAGQEAPTEGTPLADWPNSAMTRSLVEELAYYNVRTVEQLATLDEAALARIGLGAQQLRATARTFLEVARTGTAPLEKMLKTIEELTARADRQDAVIEAQAAEIDRLRPEGLPTSPTHGQTRSAS
jgi:hypothetical protein